MEGPEVSICMTNLMKIVSSNKQNIKNKTDACLVMLQHFKNDKLHTEQFLEKHANTFLASIKQSLKNSLSGKSEKVALAALLVLGEFLHCESILKHTDEGLLDEVLTILCAMLLGDRQKLFYVRSFWCFAHQNIPSHILSKHISSVVLAFAKHITGEKMKTQTILNEGLKAIKKLCEVCPMEMENEIEKCVDGIFTELTSSHRPMRDCALEVLKACMPILLKNETFTRKYLINLLNEKLGSLLNNFYHSSICKMHSLKVWTCILKLLGESFFLLDRDAISNPMLKVIKLAFNEKSQELLSVLYDLWRAFIDIVFLKPGEFVKRRDKLILPAKHRSCQHHDIAEKCLITYWHLICEVGDQINENIDEVVIPILEIHLSTQGVAIDNGKNKVDVTPKRISNERSSVQSPKVSFPSLKLLSLGMMHQLLLAPGNRRMNAKMVKLENYVGPQISPQNLLKHLPKFTQLLIEATKSCITANETVVYHVWALLLTAVAKFPNNIDVDNVWVSVLTEFKYIIDDELGSVNAVLKLLLSIPLEVLKMHFKELSYDGNEKGFPTLFLMKMLVNEKFLTKRKGYENERFFVLYQRLIELIFSGVTGQLSAVDTIFMLLNKVSSTLDNSISWRLWSTLTHSFNHYVFMTNDVNQGNALKYDFSVAIKTLLHPIQSIDLSKLKDAEKKNMMDTWSEVYKTFDRAIDLLPAAENNLLLGEFCKALMRYCDGKDKKRSMDIIIQMLRIVIKSVKFVDDTPINPDTICGIQIMSNKPTKKSEILAGNLAYYEKCLKLLGTSLLQDHGQSTRINDNLFEVLEIIGYYFEQLKSCTALYNAICLLGELITDVFGKSLEVSTKLFMHSKKLLITIFSVFETAPNIEYHSKLLTTLEPVIIKSVTCSRKRFVSRTVKFWNNTFGRNEFLEHSTNLKNALINSNTPVKAEVMRSKSMSNIIADYCEEAQFPDSSDSSNLLSPQKLKQRVSMSISPAKIHGSFLHSGKHSPLPKLFSPPKQFTSPAIPSSSRYVRRRLPIDLATMHSNDFVEIKEAPKKSRLLTEHQKEVMREKKNIPLMYNNLDQSQDTSLFQNLSQDVNSQHVAIGISDAVVGKENIPLKKNDSNNANDNTLIHILTQDTNSPPMPIKTEITYNNPVLGKEIIPLKVAYSDNDPDLVEVDDCTPSTNISCKKEPEIPNVLVTSEISAEDTMEDNSDSDIIPSSQTQDIFSQMRSPFVDNNQDNHVNKIADSPTNCLKNVSITTVTNELLENEAYNTSNKDDCNEDPMSAAQRDQQKCNLFESNKDNTSADDIFCKSPAKVDSVGIKLSKELNDENVLKDSDTNEVNSVQVKAGGGDTIEEKYTPTEEETCVVNLDAQVVVTKVTQPGKRKRKSVPYKNVSRKKKRFTKSVSPTKNVVENDLPITKIKPETDAFEFFDHENVIVQTSKPTKKTRKQLKKSPGKKNQHNASIKEFLTSDFGIKTKIESGEKGCNEMDQKSNYIHCKSESEVDEKKTIFEIERFADVTVSIIDTGKAEVTKTDIDINCDCPTISDDKFAGASEVSSPTNLTMTSDGPSSPTNLTMTSDVFPSPIKLVSVSDECSSPTNLFKPVSTCTTFVSSTSGNSKLFGFDACSSPTNLFQSLTTCVTSTTIADSPKRDIQGGAKNPFITATGSPTQGIMYLPSPVASPVNGILKKRTLNSKSPSPPFKNRRVSFQLPEGTLALKSEPTDLVQPILEKEKFTTIICNKVKEQKPKVVACIYPELVKCTTPIEKILPSLTFSRGVGHIVRAQNILTVGDLSSLSETQVENLPIRSPKIRTVRNALQAFSSQVSRQPKMKSPLFLDNKLIDFSSPQKGDANEAEEAALLATPSRHGESAKPTALFPGDNILMEAKQDIPFPPSMDICKSVDLLMKEPMETKESNEVCATTIKDVYESTNVSFKTECNEVDEKLGIHVIEEIQTDDIEVSVEDFSVDKPSNVSESIDTNTVEGYINKSIPEPLTVELLMTEPLMPEPLITEPLITEPLMPEVLMPEVLMPEALMPEALMPEALMPEAFTSEPLTSEQLTNIPKGISDNVCEIKELETVIIGNTQESVNDSSESSSIDIYKINESIAPNEILSSSCDAVVMETSVSNISDAKTASVLSGSVEGHTMVSTDVHPSIISSSYNSSDNTINNRKNSCLIPYVDIPNLSESQLLDFLNELNASTTTVLAEFTTRRGTHHVETS